MARPKNPQNLQQLDPAIQFADETESYEPMFQVEQETPQLERVPYQSPALIDQSEMNRINEQVAKQVLQEFKHLDMEKSFPVKRPIVQKLSESEAKKLQPKVFMVMNEKKIRRGAASYVLPQGKVLNANQYDIADLRRQGVQLDEVAQD